MKLATKLSVKYLFILTILSFVCGCSTLNYLKYAKEEEFRKNSEFEQKVIVKEIEPPPEPAEMDVSEVKDLQNENQKSESLVAEVKKDNLNKKETGNKKETLSKVEKNKSIKNQFLKNKIILEDKPKKRLPEIEDSEGFLNGSRVPEINPFKVGEKITHTVRYFSAEAATMNLEIKPFLEVNQKKAYQFNLALKTSSLFSKFYSVDNTVETYLDVEQLVPIVHKYNARESGKLIQSHSFFDHNKLKANFWEKKYTEKSGEEKKDLSWDILPFSQNAFSGIFYMRIFKWNIGKEYSFRVADDEKNIIFKGTAIAKETLETDAGEFKAIKIKASVVSRGALTQAGHLFVWLSDDDRKIVLKLEAEIKIGKIVSEITAYRPGQ